MLAPEAASVSDAGVAPEAASVPEAPDAAATVDGTATPLAPLAAVAMAAPLAPAGADAAIAPDAPEAPIAEGNGGLTGEGATIGRGAAAAALPGGGGRCDSRAMFTCVVLLASA
jgi:hypothetical protein